MQRFEDPAQAERWCSDRGTATLGFVATMGALHEGHVSLVERSVDENEFTCVSIFVNPLQFGVANDFDHYPRDWEADCDLLAAAGCDMVFTGKLESFFPGRLDSSGGLRQSEMSDPGPGALGLEGEFRVGHFEGVATIVRRFFELVKPERAYFGQKDFQQTLVVAEVARVLGFPEIVACETSRESSGLARSSRNLRLSASEKQDALVLSQALSAARTAWQAGERDADRLREVMHAVLAGAPIELEYAAIRDPGRWTQNDLHGDLNEAVALVAAQVGPVRLIDNMRLSEPA